MIYVGGTLANHVFIYNFIPLILDLLCPFRQKLLSRKYQSTGKIQSKMIPRIMTRENRHKELKFILSFILRQDF